jgi:hypothetical protein
MVAVTSIDAPDHFWKARVGSVLASAEGLGRFVSYGILRRFRWFAALIVGARQARLGCAAARAPGAQEAWGLRAPPYRPTGLAVLAARRCGRWLLSHGRLFINFVSSLVGPIAAPGW